MHLKHDLRPGPDDPLERRAALEEQCLQVVAAHVDAEHTALRAFGPRPPLASVAEEQLVDLFANQLELSPGEPRAPVDVVDLLPQCDRCGSDVLARHAAVLRSRQGQLLSAMLCTACYQWPVTPRTSVLAGVQLVLLAEVSDRVRERVDVLVHEAGIASPWVSEHAEEPWVQPYRSCGFGGPDDHGRMSRELFGESIWVARGPSEMVRIEAVHRDRRFSQTSLDYYMVPASWTQDQVRHLLRQIFPLSRRSNTYSRLHAPLEAAQDRMELALDSEHLPQTLLDDVPAAARRSAYLPRGPSLAASDATHCARASRNRPLISRLAVEHPDPTVRRTACERLDRLRTGAGQQKQEMGLEDWVPWQHQPPSWIATPAATLAWTVDAGIHRALFSLDSPQQRWADAVHSRPVPASSY